MYRETNQMNILGNSTVSFYTGSVVVIAGRPRDRSSSHCGIENFHFSISSRLALVPTQPPIKWVQRTLFPGVKRPGREDEYLRLVLRTRKRGSINPLPHTSPWRSA
jgi:hypothetical protein